MHDLVKGFAPERSGADRGKPVALGELEEAALAAAVVAAVLMLLASAGVGLASSVAQTVEAAVLMSTSMAASEAALQGVAGFQGVAGLHPIKETTTPPSPPTVSTQILDGQKALNWLQDRNMLDEDGNLTEKFNTWFDRAPGDTGTGPSDLEGFAGNINRIRPDGKEGPIAGSKLDGPIAIIVRELVLCQD